MQNEELLMVGKESKQKKLKAESAYCPKTGCVTGLRTRR